MWQAFTEQSTYTKRARWGAILWTLLIFILCLLPGNELPEVNIPMIDKWTHWVLFGIFAFLWLCAAPSRKPGRLLLILGLSVFVGWLVEEIQGALSFLGRYKDNMDTLADSIGGLCGVLIFYILSLIAVRRTHKE